MDVNTSPSLYTRSAHSASAVSAGTRRDLRYLFTEHLLLEQRYLKELLMEYHAAGLDAADEITATYGVITAELERRADVYRRCNDRSWPDANGKWYDSLLEQARTLKDIWPIDKFFGVVVGVDLKPAGHQRFRGHCPFHSDTNPSLKVSIDYDNFKCWSCGASGDIFQATGLYFDIDAFPDQVEKVADVTGSMMSSAHIITDTYEQTQREIEAAVLR